jgi:hypothetical protein
MAIVDLDKVGRGAVDNFDHHNKLSVTVTVTVTLRVFLIVALIFVFRATLTLTLTHARAHFVPLTKSLPSDDHAAECCLFTCSVPSLGRENHSTEHVNKTFSVCSHNENLLHVFQPQEVLEPHSVHAKIRA